MLMDFVQAIIPPQQSTKKVRQRSAKQLFELVRIEMADTQLDVNAATAQYNPPQLRAVSSLIQISLK
jgi:hypothetical protein